MSSRKPVVAIVGRPNVGKSSLFNRIVKRRHAVVDDVAGVTRDRNYLETSWEGIEFTLTDTGGLIPGSKDPIAREIGDQVDYAVAEAHAIIFLTDAKSGATDVDMLIGRQLRKAAAGKVVLAVNKAESQDFLEDYEGFASLGCGDPVAVSALHGTGIRKLLDLVCDRIRANYRPPIQAVADVPTVSIAILGRPNAGKSSLVNKLLGHKRMIVDDVPGTTRDAIDSYLTHNGALFRLIDTAGLRRRTQVRDGIEYYANLRALASIDRSDVCAVLVDASQGVGEQDLKILTHVERMRRGLMVCLNKWDIVEKNHRTFDQTVAALRQTYKELKYVPFVSMSALTGQRVLNVLETAMAIKARMRLRVPAGEFSEELFNWTRTKPHPMIRSREVRILGGKQVAADFPLFHLFAAGHEFGSHAYARYIANSIHDKYGFQGCPVVVTYRPAARPRSRRGYEPETGKEE